MAQAVWTGPIIALGGIGGGPNLGPPREYSDEIGPSMFWAGSGMPIPSGSGSKDMKGAGGIPAVYFSSPVIALNQNIAAAGATLATGTAAAGTPLPLTTTYAAGIGPGAPISGGKIGVAIEPGYAIVATTANSGNITINANDAWRFHPGMFISIAGAGPGGAMMFAQVTGITPPTTLVVTPPPVTTQGAAQIGPVAGNPNSYGWSARAYSSMVNGGAGRFYMPDCGAARTLALTGGTGAVLIQGLDMFMRPTSELVAAGAAPKKTYKVLLAVIPQFSGGTVTVTTGGTVGLPIAALQGQPEPTVGGTPTAPSTYADLTNPATTSTGDPRGTIAAAGGALTTIIQTISPAQAVSASGINAGTLFGVTPV